MTTPGPDSLREIARFLRQKDAYIFLNMTAGKVDAHADAWDDDILRQDVYDENYRKELAKNAALRDECQVLRQRLEVAGRLVYAALQNVEDWPDGFDIVLWHKTQTAEFAALASQEVKP